MSPRKLFILILSTTLGIAIQVQVSLADEIRIPIGEHAKNQAAIDMPTKGMSKARVRSLFGEPLEEMQAKGQPPIARWKYSEFTVYFDRDAVIHCVRSFRPTTPPEIHSSESNR